MNADFCAFWTSQKLSNVHEHGVSLDRCFRPFQHVVPGQGLKQNVLARNGREVISQLPTILSVSVRVRVIHKLYHVWQVFFFSFNPCPPYSLVALRIRASYVRFRHMIPIETQHTCTTIQHNISYIHTTGAQWQRYSCALSCRVESWMTHSLLPKPTDLRSNVSGRIVFVAMGYAQQESDRSNGQMLRFSRARVPQFEKTD